MIPEKFTMRVHPALMEMAQGDLVRTKFASQEERVGWLRRQMEAAAGLRHPDAEFFTRELMAHSEILRAQREG